MYSVQEEIAKNTGFWNYLMGVLLKAKCSHEESALIAELDRVNRRYIELKNMGSRGARW